MGIAVGKINRDPKEAGLDIVQADLLWLRAEWLAACKVTDKTRRDYEQKTRYFVEWWRDYGPIAEWRLTERHLVSSKSDQMGFETWLCQRRAMHTGKPLAWHTRHDALRRVREMFRWAQEIKIIEGVDCAAWVPSASGEAPERTAPTIEHLWRLMDAAAKSRYPLRDQTILAMFIGTGIRRCELARLEAHHIVFCADDSGTAAITGKRTKANRSGKRTVAFDAFTGRYLIAYLDEMQISEGPLFFNDRRGTPLRGQGVYKMVKRAIVAAGLEGKVQACHDLRRAFTTILSLHDINDPIFIDMIRRQLGHKHYAQTAEYTKIDAEHIRERIVSPLALAGGKASHLANN